MKQLQPKTGVTHLKITALDRIKMRRLYAHEFWSPRYFSNSGSRASRNTLSLGQHTERTPIRAGMRPGDPTCTSGVARRAGHSKRDSAIGILRENNETGGHQGQAQRFVIRVANGEQLFYARDVLRKRVTKRVRTPKARIAQVAGSGIAV